MKVKLDKDKVRKIYDRLNYPFDFKEFFVGMNVELEHKDVTHGNLVQTAKIAAAHLREKPNYYTLLLRNVEGYLSTPPV